MRNKSTTKTQSTVLSMRVDKLLTEKIQLLANAEKRSKNNMIRILLEEALGARAKKSARGT
jgi:hypothetical protein